MLIVGAPVAERAWILPDWFERLRQQTVRPDGFVFIYSKSEDDTLGILERADGVEADFVNVFHTKLPYHSRNARNADQEDPWRAEHMARLRNLLRRESLKHLEMDYFLSLDTDVLLEDPTIIEQLLQTLQSGEWDVATALTYLHPLGAESGCTNAGYLGGGGGFTQTWQRVPQTDTKIRLAPFRIEIPMACFMIKRHAWGMSGYHPHESGEDIGFAQALASHRLRVAYRPDLEGRHVWDPPFLMKEEPDAQAV